MNIEELGYNLKYGTSGQTQALEKLVDFLGNSLQNFFKKRLPTWAITQEVHKDLEHDAWARLLEKAKDFDPYEGRLDSFLWGIVKRVWLEWLRKQKRSSNLQEWLLEVIAKRTTGLPQEKQEAYLDLFNCLIKLANRDWDIFIAVVAIYMEGLTEREAGKIIGIAASTVHNRKVEGLNFLKNCLA